jgi:hypothetical protein
VAGFPVVLPVTGVVTPFTTRPVPGVPDTICPVLVTTGAVLLRPATVPVGVDPDPKRSRKVTDAMMTMVKFDIAALEKAYRS